MASNAFKKNVKMPDVCVCNFVATENARLLMFLRCYNQTPADVFAQVKPHHKLHFPFYCPKFSVLRIINHIY